MPLTLRLDPWASEYEGALQIDEEDAPSLSVSRDYFVETEDWRPIEPEYLPLPDTVVFIDGVQRVEVRVIGEEEGRLVYGAFASVGVGMAITRPGCSYIEAIPARRIIALGGGASCEPWTADCGTLTLTFEAESTPDTGPEGWRNAVNRTRREAEAALAQAMVGAAHPLVIVDGRLPFVQPTRPSFVIGIAKTIRTLYLEPPYTNVLRELLPGSRTPVFSIQYEQPLYSWYLRLAQPRPIDHSWAGIVQVETMAGIGLKEAMRLADLTALHLPSFASTPKWDPRAPQNLYPISALEQRLRHELGDHDWIRRHIELHFYRRGGTS